MQENQAGITALGTAYARAYHATHDSPKIFDDFLADQLFSADEHTRINEGLAQRITILDPELAATNPDQATALAGVMQILHAPVTLSRSRYTEDSLEEAVKHGVQQYVILGAGFDTFAFRRPDLPVQVFEVDHPATQALKRARTAKWELPANLHFVPIDFTKESLTTALGRSSYDPHKSSFFSWQGVTFYLTREVVFATLQAIAGIAPKSSTLVFDYMDADAFIPEKVAASMQIMQETARHVGEPMKTGFDPLALADDLRQVGFTLQENLSPAEIEARYFQNRADRYHAFAHVHFAKAVVE